ncbi:hypothetical protein STEG23_028906, partial [Scotinomys teguina]
MTLLWTESDSPEDSWVVLSGNQLTESPVVMKPSPNEKWRRLTLTFLIAKEPRLQIITEPIPRYGACLYPAGAPATHG